MLVDGRCDVKVIQLNAAKRILTHDLLMMWLTQAKGTYVLCLQEPYITHRGLGRLPREWCAFWCDFNNKKGRACIIAPKYLRGYMVTQFSSRDCVVVRFPTLDLSCIAVYCDIDISVHESMCGVSKEVGVSRNVIICIDTNAHNYAWGSVGDRFTRIKAFSRGDQLEDIIDELDLHICNDIPHKPTYFGGRGQLTHIDVTLCTPNVIHRLSDWHVASNCFESDHYPIEFMLRESSKQHRDMHADKQGVLWRKPTEGMITRMHACLPKLVTYRRRVVSQRDVNMFVQKHATEVREALEKLFTKKRGRQQEACYWWTSEVRELHKVMKRARRRMGRYKHHHLVQKYNESRRAFRKKVYEVKIMSWRNFMSGITDPWKGLMHILDSQKCRQKQNRTLCTVDGMYAKDLKDTLRLLGEQFYPAPLAYSETHRKIEHEVDIQISDTGEAENITKCEFRKALSEMSKATAPGEDGVTNCVLHILAKTCKYERQYIDVFNTCLRLGIFPSTWKQANIVLIPKSYDMIHSVKAMRPISLTSVFSKLLERIVLARILHYIELSGKLSLSQHAYRKGGSTTTALYEVAKFMQDALHDKQICMVVFLDISGAFDRTWHGGILHRLLQYGVPTYLVKWTKSFLTDRKARFQEGGEEYTRHLQQGCPQGGVLSPVLWNVLFNDMLVLKTKSDQDFHLKVVGYADDAAVLCRAGSEGKASVILTKYLTRIRQWADENRIQMNSSKVHVMTISRRFSKAPADVYYDGVRIHEVTQHKYLGLMFDNRLSWRPHVKHVLEKLAGVTRMLRGAVRESWGVRMNIMRLIFKSIFCPILLYGVAIWGWRMTGTVACAKVNKVIRKFCIMSTRCFRSTSNDMLFQLMKTQSFSVLVRQEVLKVVSLQLNLATGNEDYRYCQESMVSKNNPVSMEHFFHKCRQGLGPQIGDIVYENLLHHYSVHPCKWVSTNTRVRDKIAALWDGMKQEGWVIYTDASVSSYGAGWAFVVCRHGFCVSIQNSALSKCSIFTAEAQAVRYAIMYTMQIEGLKKREVIDICSDSQSVIRALERTVIVDPMLRAVKEELRKADKMGINVVLRWVPSHSGNMGNEMADTLAKRSVDSFIVGKTMWVKRDLKTLINSRKQQLANQQWNNVTSRIPKMFFPEGKDVHEFLRSDPSAELSQLVTGHCRLNEFMCNKVGARSSAVCACRRADETVMHYLLECSLHAQVRHDLWNECYPSLDTVTREWKKVEQFIQRTKRFVVN